MSLIWKLLKQNISKGQFFGFFVANLIGLTIVLSGVQFYSDVHSLFSGKDTLIKRHFLILTKKVGIYNALSPKSTGFSEKEIAEIRNAGFVDRMAGFSTSQYAVLAGINTGNHGSFQTEMFFESLPDEFIDVDTKDWHFSPGDNMIPIILPKNYLDLYNFGFAEARSMPRLSEGVIGMINLRITISGKGKFQTFKGKIVGFSNRIHTILVPATFMQWSNEHFGEEKKQHPNRLIVEINNPADPEIASFLQQKKYEVEGENSATSKMAYFLKIIVGIVVIVGLIICVLSFFILTLSIYLLLEKNTEKLRNLRLIGFSKAIVSRPYRWMVAVMNFGVLVLSLLFVFVLRNYYMNEIKTVWETIESPGIYPSIIAGIAILLFQLALNFFIINRQIRNITRS